MPRAIAPEVTTTTSTPARCRPATSSHTRATTERRSSPDSWATTDDPSLTTATGMQRGDPRSARPAGIELEHDSAQLDVVPGFEPARLERRDHAHAAQPMLDVRQPLVVLHVVAGDQPVDRRAGDAELALADPLDLERAPGRGPEQLELGHL